MQYAYLLELIPKLRFTPIEPSMLQLFYLFIWIGKLHTHPMGL